MTVDNFIANCIVLETASSVRVLQLLHLAAKLNMKERAEVAAELIAGLDGVDEELTPAEWHRAWRAEIAQRIAD